MNVSCFLQMFWDSFTSCITYQWYSSTYKSISLICISNLTSDTADLEKLIASICEDTWELHELTLTFACGDMAQCNVKGSISALLSISLLTFLFSLQDSMMSSTSAPFSLPSVFADHFTLYRKAMPRAPFLKVRCWIRHKIGALAKSEFDSKRMNYN